ncbi:MAG: 50S ribosomal protein L28 [Actinobacteria bacterium]|nr:50S ribosomal protein L28 [Actinomycetota bacterium]
MAKKCDICGKGTAFGNTISHSHKVNRRRFLPNLKKVNAEINGSLKRINVCTKCLKAGKVKVVV